MALQLLKDGYQRVMLSGLDGWLVARLWQAADLRLTLAVDLGS
jgi:hypothetical protein